MALNLAFDGFYSILAEKVINEEDNSDEENDIEDRRKKLINHKKSRTIKGSSQTENLALVLGVFFLASTLCYVVYLTYTDRPSDQGVVYSHIQVKDTYDNSLYNELPQKFIPVQYTLYLYLHTKEREYNGLVKIRAKCMHNASSVMFRSSHHQIGKVTIKTVNITDIEDILVTEAQRSERESYVILNINQELVENFVYDFYIGFKGNISNSVSEGMFSTINDSGTIEMLSTFFSPNLAHRVFPCFDDPSYKTPFQLILQHNRKYNAVSNMEIERIVPIDGSNVETHFQITSPLTVFQVSFVLTLINPKKVTKNGVKIRIFSEMSESTELAFSILPTLLEAMERNTNFNYTLSKLDFVSSATLPVPMCSSYGIVLMKEELLLFNNNSGTLFEKEQVMIALTRAVTSQWFGGILSFSQWNNQWLFDGLAQFFQRILLDELYRTKWNFVKLYFDRFFHEPLRLDASIFSKPLNSNKDPTLGGMMYNEDNSHKGAVVMMMLYDIIGKEGFLKAVRMFTRNKAFAASSLDDFCSVFVLDSPSINVIDFVHFWADQSGYPLVIGKTANMKRQLSIDQSAFFEPLSNKWNVWRFQVPIKFSCDVEVKSYMMTSHNDLFAFPQSCANSSNSFSANDWFILNNGGRGFFRVDFEKSNWVAIKKQLDKNSQNFSEVNRANLIDDLFELAKFNYRSVQDALTFTLYMIEERNFLPMQTLLRHLDYIESMATDKKMKGCIKDYILDQIKPAFAHVAGIDNKTVEEKHLFHILVDRIVDRNDDYSKSYIMEYDIDFLEWEVSSEGKKLPDYLRDIIFKVGIKYGTKYELNNLKKYFLNANTCADRNLILRSLPFSTDLYSMLTNDENGVFTKWDVLQYLTYNCDNNNSRSIAFNKLSKPEFYEGLFEAPSVVKLFIQKCVGKGSTKMELQKARDILENMNIGVLYKSLSRAIESIERNLMFIENQLPGVAAWLEKHRKDCMKS